mgnify:FL=1
MRSEYRRGILKFGIAAAMIAVAMVCRYLTKTEDLSDLVWNALSLLRTGIYLSLIYMWMLSIRFRIRQSQVRNYLMMTGFLLLFWFGLRTCKYNYVHSMNGSCICWYGFYIPMVLIPQMAVFVACCLGKREDYRIPWGYRLLYIPSTIAIAVVLTNSFHQKVFIFPPGAENPLADYTYGPAYYCVIGWILAEVTLFFAILFLRRHRSKLRWRNSIVFLPILVMIGYSILYIRKARFIYWFAGDMTAALTVMILATWELCIAFSIIPSNSNHAMLFRYSTVGAKITDSQLNIIYRSEGDRVLNKKTLLQALIRPINFDKFRLAGTKIRGGYVFWNENISDVRKTMQELQSIREQLREKNRLLQSEVKLQEEKARINEQIRLYDSIRSEIHPKLSQLETLLEQMDVDSIEGWMQICVLGTDIKRRSNLILLGEESGQIPVRELELSLQESMENLKLCRVPGNMICRGAGYIDKENAVRLYDAAEWLLEQVWKTIRAFIITVAIQDNAGYVAFNVDGTPDVLGDAKTVFMEEFGLPCDIQIQERDIRIRVEVGTGGTEQ